MVTELPNLADTIGLIQEQVADLGFGHNDDRFEQLQRFSEGPVKLGVVGREKSGRSSLIKSLTDSFENVVFEERSVPTTHPLDLFDAIILCTPADAALSHEEVELARELVKIRRPVIVAITGTEFLGTGKSQDKAKEEITRFRLAPLLNPLQVSYDFVEKNIEKDSPLHKFLTQLTMKVASTVHMRPVLDLLRSLIDEYLTKLAARLEARKRDNEALQQLDAQQPLVEARLLDIKNLAKMHLREELRIGRDELFRTGEKCAESLVSWLQRNGIDPIDDIGQLFEEGWEQFIEAVDKAGTRADELFEKEAFELMIRPYKIGETLEVNLDLPELPSLAWRNSKVERVRSQLVDTQPNPAFEAAKSVALETLERIQRQREEEKEGEGDDARRGSSFDRVGGRMSNWLSEQFGVPVERKIQDALLDALDAIVSPRWERYTIAATDAMEESSTEQYAAFISAYNASVESLRTAIANRYAWSNSYATLLRVGDELSSLKRRV